MVVEVEELDGKDAEEHRDERPRHDGRVFLQRDDEDERRRADEEGDPARAAELADEPPELLEEVTLGLLDPEQLRQLADDDREREADDEALQHRLRDEARQEAEPEEPGGEGEEADDQRERDRELDERIRARRSEIADRGGRERRRGRHRPRDEVAGAPERGVEDQRAGRRVEADDRRDTGDRRVRERLRHEHRPNGQSGDDVAAQPPPLVAVEPAEHRELHRAGLIIRQPRDTTAR